MLKYIPGHDLGDYPLVEAIWEYRHRHFVDRFGWVALRKPDNREIDDFDGPDALHLILEDGGRIVGYSRLLPTRQPHLLSHVYPEIAQGVQYPTGRRIYEWTRCVAEPGAIIAGLPASNVLMTGVMEFCLSCGIANLIVETHPRLVNWLMSAGWDITPFAGPTVLPDGPVLPIEARPSLDGLRKHHEVYGINGSVLTVDRTAVNPITGGVFETVLDHPHQSDLRSKRYATG